MARKHDALPRLLLGVDVDAANQDSVAAIEEDEEDEAADVGDPAGQLRIVRQQPQIQRHPYATPDVHGPQEAQQEKGIRDYQPNQALKTRADVSHQRLQAKRHGDYQIPDGLKFGNVSRYIIMINVSLSR